MSREGRQINKKKFSIKNETPRTVHVSVIFTRINDIDTVNEKFNCEATVFARWQEDIDNLKNYDQKTSKDLINGPKKETEECEQMLYWDSNSFWDPQLYIDNVVGEIREKDVKYRIETYRNNENGTEYLEVHMIKRIQGLFFEKLELYHFPFDVQDLSLVITSHKPVNEIHLVEDNTNPSKVTKHASLDKHIWKLHDHINTKMQIIRNDYPIQINDIADDEYCQSSMTFQCRVSRKPGYFVVNCLLPTLMITLCVFFTFLMDHKRYQYRFSLLFTSMLTSVTFRFSIHGRVLPTISYLTFLDMYCVSSILIVFTCMICHGIYCVLHSTNEAIAMKFDVYSMCFIGLAVLIMHLIQIIWFFVAFRKRTKLNRLDKTAIIDNHKHLRALKPQVNSKIQTNKTYFSIAKLEDSSLILFKEYLKTSSQYNDQMTWCKYNNQNTLTTPSAMNIFNQRFKLTKNHEIFSNSYSNNKIFLRNDSYESSDKFSQL